MMTQLQRIFYDMMQDYLGRDKTINDRKSLKLMKKFRHAFGDRYSLCY